MSTDFPYPRCLRNVDRQRSYELAVAENPRNARRTRTFGAFDKFWMPGKTLWISFSFFEVDRRHKWAIYELAQQWLDMSGANLDIDLTEDDSTAADIRIELCPRLLHNHSNVGTDALADKSTPSMVLNLLPGHKDFERTVLHEFGHAFGALHEHQHPDAGIPWNVPATLEHFQKFPGWSEQDIMEQMLNKNTDSGHIMTPYDRLSIMHYPVSQAMTLGDWEVGINTELSEGDLAFMRLAYPDD